MASLVPRPVVLLAFALSLAGCKEQAGMLLYAFALAGILTFAVVLMRLAINASSHGSHRPR